MATVGPGELSSFLAAEQRTFRDIYEAGRAHGRTEVTGETSDGYHTFNELYDHRRALTAVIAGWAATTQGAAWRSKAHHPDDDPMFPGYFIVGIELDTGTITYHYELEHWDSFEAVPELEHGKKWDGAGSADTITRLLELAKAMARFQASRPS